MIGFPELPTSHAFSVRQGYEILHPKAFHFGYLPLAEEPALLLEMFFLARMVPQ
jgi:hypothetical protein